MSRILVVDDEEDLLKMLTVMLSEESYIPVTATSAEKALELLHEENFDLILSDIRMEGMSGIELLKRVKKLDPDLPIIMMTAYGSIEDAVSAMKAGAYYYLIKPVKMDELLLLIQRALGHRKILNENRELRSELEEKFHFKNIVGNGEKMQQVYRLIEKISRTDSTALLTGESGTGKELVARALHYNSLRKNRSFVAISCAALPETLLESELFGHVKGAFTGAIQQKEGLFSVADGGTVFLDEISASSPTIQTKLLRVLQEKEIKKVGNTRTEKVNVRIIAATNLSLEEEVKKKNFREDLYYRISVIPIDLPPLRDRKEDIPLLVKHFLEKVSSKQEGKTFTLEDSVLEALMRYNWPGNIRELENVIERMVTLSDSEVIADRELPPQISQMESPLEEPTSDTIPQECSLKKVVESKEAQHIHRILDHVHGDKKKASELLDIDLATLYRKIEKLGLK